MRATHIIKLLVDLSPTPVYKHFLHLKHFYSLIMCNLASALEIQEFFLQHNPSGRCASCFMSIFDNELDGSGCTVILQAGFKISVWKDPQGYYRYEDLLQKRKNVASSLQEVLDYLTTTYRGNYRFRSN